METNLSINKEIIKNLLDSSKAVNNVADDTSPGGNPPTLLNKLQQSLKSLQGEYVNQ